jgi:hypothetical protein
MYFVVSDWSRPICGYTWRIGWGRTSFYAKARYRPLTSLKISLHGPDKRHARPGFKVAIENDALAVAHAAGGTVAGDVAHEPRWFSGCPGEDGSVHAVRYRWTSDLFEEGDPSAPIPRDIRPTAQGSVIPLPPPGFSADVDIFVTEGSPYWPNEIQARQDNACLGPLRNEADQYLTGISRRRSVVSVPSPASEIGPVSPDARVRGVESTIDSEGLLWIIERWLPIKMFGTPRANQEDGKKIQSSDE